MIVFFGVAMLLKWLQAPPDGVSFFDWNLGQLSAALTIDAQISLGEQTATGSLPFMVSEIDQGGYLILVAFAIIGALFLLNPLGRSQKGVIIAGIAAILFLIPSGFQLFSLESILPGRWFLFLFVPLSILAMFGLFRLANLIKRRFAAASVIAAVTLATVFMMVTNSVANDDSPYVYNEAKRVGYTQSELASLGTLADIGAGRPVTDIHYGSVVPFVIGFESYNNMLERTNIVFIERNYYLQNPEWNQFYTARIHLGDRGQTDPETWIIAEYIRDNGIDNNPIIYRNQNVTVYAAAEN